MPAQDPGERHLRHGKAEVCRYRHELFDCFK